MLIVAGTDALAAVAFGESIARAYAAPLLIKKRSHGGGLVALGKPA
jgi:hypothetical protein